MPLDPSLQAACDRLLAEAYPDAAARFFAPMIIGSTPQDADEGAALILDGVKTATSSGFWAYPDGRIPFAGALSVLLDGAGRPRAVVETLRVEVVPFRAVDEDFARAYGEGERRLAWWRRVIGAWYRADASAHGAGFDESTPLICEWIAVARRLSGSFREPAAAPDGSTRENST